MSKVKLIQEYCERLEKVVNRDEKRPEGFHKVKLIASVRPIYDGKFFQHDLSICVDMVPIYTERIVSDNDSPEIRFKNQEVLAERLLFYVFGYGVMASRSKILKCKILK